MTSPSTTCGLRGVLHIFSDQGMEGSDFAFQDERFIEQDTTTMWCAKCHVVRTDASKLKSYFPSMTDKAVRKAVERLEGEKHQWELMFPDGKWSFEGLHIPRGLDELLIFDKASPTQLVWSGSAELLRQQAFEESQYRAQEYRKTGVLPLSRFEMYFAAHYPAQLIPFEPGRKETDDES